MRLRKVSRLAILTALALAVFQQNLASAAQTQLPAYDGGDGPTHIQNDLTGLATATAVATPDRTTGALSGRADAYGTAPAGASVAYTPVVVGQSYGAANPRILHSFAVTGGGTLSVQAQITSISGQVSITPAPQYDPVTGYYCTNCTSAAYAAAYFQAYAYYYPCAPITATCYSTTYGGSGYVYLESISGGTTTLNFNVAGTPAGSGTLIVVVSAVAAASATGQASGTSIISGTVSSITVGP